MLEESKVDGMRSAADKERVQYFTGDPNLSCGGTVIVGGSR